MAELLQHPGLVEPECPDVKAVVFDGDPGDRTPVLGRSAVDINDPSPDLGVFVGDEGRHGGDVRQIEDVAGSMNSRSATVWTDSRASSSARWGPTP